MCAAKIAAERANDLGQVAEWAVDRGHTMGMVTMTMPITPGNGSATCGTP